MEHSRHALTYHDHVITGSAGERACRAGGAFEAGQGQLWSVSELQLPPAPIPRALHGPLLFTSPPHPDPPPSPPHSQRPNKAFTAVAWPEPPLKLRASSRGIRIEVHRRGKWMELVRFFFFFKQACCNVLKAKRAARCAVRKSSDFAARSTDVVTSRRRGSRCWLS